jgi:hypothetical protein
MKMDKVENANVMKNIVSNSNKAHRNTISLSRKLIKCVIAFLIVLH